MCNNIEDSYRRVLSELNDGYTAFHKVGAVAIDPGLDTTMELARRLGDPQNAYRTIHVGGTNGKGSVAHTLASVLQSAGYRVGLYTSPHLLDFRERIRIDGKMIARSEVVAFMERFKKVEYGFHPSFFEVCTLMAFWCFAKAGVDVAVVEVGLGGRLDSTNIITPMLSVVTNISLDHTGLLGNTEPLIAAEKAGIFKPGVPAVVGEAQGEVRAVFERKAAEIGAPLVFAADSDEIKEVSVGNEGMQCYDTVGFGHIASPLTGECQYHNALTVLEAVKSLRRSQLDITAEAVRAGFSQVCVLTGLMGRWTIVDRHPLTVCDTGHNPGGWIYTARRLKTFGGQAVRLVIGFVSDKDVDSVLGLLRGIPRLHVYACRPSVDRALPATMLAEKVNDAGLQLASVDDEVSRAYGNAVADASESDMIFVGGSTFVVADFLASRGLG